MNKKIVGETFTGYNSGLSHANEAACLKSCDDSTICDGFLFAQGKYCTMWTKSKIEIVATAVDYDSYFKLSSECEPCQWNILKETDKVCTNPISSHTDVQYNEKMCSAKC